MENPMIVVDPDIMLGKPVIAGTRITVGLILEKMAAGETIEQIMEEYPLLTTESIFAALDWELMEHSKNYHVSTEERNENESR